jgi:hypothetical protein
MTDERQKPLGCCGPLGLMVAVCLLVGGLC